MPTEVAQYAPLVNVGAVGLILWWFMQRAEVRFKAIEDAIDRSTKSQMLSILSRNDVRPEIKAEAQAVLDEVKDAGKK
jgi:hypothetical protein